MLLEGQPRPYLKRAVPQHPNNFWDPYLCPYGLMYSDQIQHGNTCGGTRRVPIGSATPHPKGAGPQSPQFWDLLRVRTRYENSNKIYMVIKLYEIEKKIFYRVNHAPPAPAVARILTRMLTRDSFAVANLLSK